MRNGIFNCSNGSHNALKTKRPIVQYDFPIILRVVFKSFHCKVKFQISGRAGWINANLRKTVCDDVPCGDVEIPQWSLKSRNEQKQPSFFWFQSTENASNGTHTFSNAVRWDPLKARPFCKCFPIVVVQHAKEVGCDTLSALPARSNFVAQNPWENSIFKVHVVWIMAALCETRIPGPDSFNLETIFLDLIQIQQEKFKMTINYWTNWYIHHRHCGLFLQHLKTFGISNCFNFVFSLTVKSRLSVWNGLEMHEHNFERNPWPVRCLPWTWV